MDGSTLCSSSHEVCEHNATRHLPGEFVLRMIWRRTNWVGRSDLQRWFLNHLGIWPESERWDYPAKMVFLWFQLCFVLAPCIRQCRRRSFRSSCLFGTSRWYNLQSSPCVSKEPISISRMGLQATVVGARLSAFIKEHHSLVTVKCMMWSIAITFFVCYGLQKASRYLLRT